MSQRLLRVRELLKREIGLVVARDYVFDSLVTVNDVDVTPDLRNGHVFVGVIGGEGEGRKAVALLNRERGNIQRQLNKRVVLKYSPKLHFKLDDSVERGVRTLSVIEGIDGEDHDGEEGDQDDWEETEEVELDREGEDV